MRTFIIRLSQDYAERFVYDVVNFYFLRIRVSIHSVDNDTFYIIEVNIYDVHYGIPILSSYLLLMHQLYQCMYVAII